VKLLRIFRVLRLSRFSLGAGFQCILTPVLVISGKYDFKAPYLIWKDFGKNMPDNTFHLFENAGHTPS